MAPWSAPEPDGLTVRELRRVPPEVLALIANNFLTHHRLPEDLRESRTVFLPKCPDATTATELRPITISSVLRRIKQGDPLSRFLFNLTLDPLLHELNSSGYGYNVDGHTVSALAYADDLILIASTYEELSRNLEVAQAHFKKIELALNPKKTQYLVGGSRPTGLSGSTMTSPHFGWETP
ncbi:hypothetical protein MTO96_051817 [Rhipicephalus appendiculatus]